MERPIFNIDWLKVNGFFLAALLGASMPFLLLRFTYPTFLLQPEGSSAYFNISNLLVADMTFIGIALVLSYFLFWSENFSNGSIKHFRKVVSSIAAALAVAVCLLSVGVYVLLNRLINVEPRHIERFQSANPKEIAEWRLVNQTEILDAKFAAFWLLFTVIVLTYTSVFVLHPLLKRGQ